MPHSAAEVALAPQSIKALHTAVGAQVLLSGSDGSHSFTVTGSALVPNGYHNNYADGGWITDTGYADLFASFKFHTVYVALTPSAQAADAAATLPAALGARDPRLGDYQLQAPEELAAVTGLRAVRILPILLGGFLALLAIGAVGHALATAVRRRSHDLAVLRTLGMTKRQCRWVVVVQGSVLALIGLLFGVPLGLAVGRTIWRALADHTPFLYVTPVAAWVLILIGPGALLAANLLAAWPGHRAARLRIAQVLRTE
jgi:predicted lysophospholipase L1 biosynthesis ABC-type transport system permease subunit